MASSLEAAVTSWLASGPVPPLRHPQACGPPCPGVDSQLTRGQSLTCIRCDSLLGDCSSLGSRAVRRARCSPSIIIINIINTSLCLPLPIPPALSGRLRRNDFSAAINQPNENTCQPQTAKTIASQQQPQPTTANTIASQQQPRSPISGSTATGPERSTTSPQASA